MFRSFRRMQMPKPAPSSDPISGSIPGAAADRPAPDLAALRARVRRLEGVGGVRHGVVPTGVAEIDAALPGGGLARGALHAVGGMEGHGADGAVAGFTAALAGLLAGPRAVLWLGRRADLYAPGLAALGLGPERLLVAVVPRSGTLLWAMETALGCPAIGAVVGEADDVDLTEGRRLQLAASAGGGAALLIGAEGAAAAVTRWQVAAAPSPAPDDLPGLGRPRWALELARCKGAAGGGRWLVEWTGRGLAPAGPPVVAGAGAAADGRPETPDFIRLGEAAQGSGPMARRVKRASAG